MEKEELLRQIKDSAQQGLISKDDILDAFEGDQAEKGSSHPKIARILYYIGGAIVFLSIVILVFQNWRELNTSTRIIATFGSGIAAYIVALMFSRREKLDTVGQAFHLISALITPIGLFVIFDAAGMDVEKVGLQVLVSGILLAVYLSSFAVFRKNIFIIFSTIVGTWFFFALTSWMDSNGVLDDLKFFEYRILLTGITYSLLGYYFSGGMRRVLTGPLYGFGSLFFLGSALGLGGWDPNQNVFWELIFPALVFGVIFLSIKLRSRTFLVFGSFFLMSYILKITGEYFTEGLGWPFALALAGFSLIGVGYLSFYLNNKFIKR